MNPKPNNTNNGLQNNNGNLLVEISNGFRLSKNGEEINIRHRKAKALIAYLSLTGSHSEKRERLVSILWSDKDSSAGRASLRQCLQQLKMDLHSDHAGFIRSFRTEIQISGIDVDLTQFIFSLNQYNTPLAMLDSQFSVENFLCDYTEIDPLFDTWITVNRQYWQNELISKLEFILGADDALASQKLDASNAIINIDFTHEQAQCYIIERYARSGQQGAAIRQYNQLWTLLDQEYQLEPVEETQQLIAKIKLGELCGEQPISAQPSTKLPRNNYRLPVIEVMNPVAIDPGGTPNILLYTFRNELISCLVKFRVWVVIKNNENKDIDAANADYQLSIDYVNTDESVQALITLSNSSQQVLWSETFSLLVDNWQRSIQRIASSTSSSLDTYISADAFSNNLLANDISLDAYRLWIKAQDLLVRWDNEAEMEAEALFTRINDEWPEFARAYSGLASIYNSRHIVIPGVFRNPKTEAKAHRLAVKASQIDPLDANCRMSVAWSLCMLSRFDEAELHFSMAAQLNPHNPSILMSAAQGMAFCDNAQSAEELLGQAEQLSMIYPENFHSYLVGIKFLSDDFQECISAANKAGSHINNLQGWKSIALAIVGESEQARECSDQFCSYISDNWTADKMCTKKDVWDWFLHSFPIKSKKHTQMMSEVIEKYQLHK